MIILKTRSEVKVTVTRKWLLTLHHSEMHLHKKFRIPTSKNIGDMHQTQCSFLGTQKEVKFKVKVNQLWYGTLCNSKMHPQTKFEIPTSNNMRYAPDMIILKTRAEVKVTVT